MFSPIIKNGLRILAATAVSMASFQASADIVISGTRIVYQQSMKDVIVNMITVAKTTVIQVWLDDGRANANPQELKLPFVITPPITRIDPGKGQSVCDLFTATSTTGSGIAVLV
jgi:chaperone protein EcpD